VVGKAPALVVVLVTRVGTCKRCGRPIVATAGDLCGPCDRIINRAADDAHKREVRKERSERDRLEGARPFRRWR
jgi:hypothetical protein